MHLNHYFSLAFPLGLAGFDPAPVLLAVLFLARNNTRAGRRAVLLFSALILLGTMLWGVLLAQLLGAQIQRSPWHEMMHWVLQASLWATILKLVVGLGLIGYGIFAIRKKRKDGGTGEKDAEKAKSAKGLYLFALTFIVVVTSDVPFAAYVGFSGHQALWAQVLGLSIWALIAQFPLVLLVLAMLTGRDARFVAVLHQAQKKIAPLFAWGIPVICLLLGFSLILDALVMALLHLFH